MLSNLCIIFTYIYIYMHTKVFLLNLRKNIRGRKEEKLENKLSEMEASGQVLIPCYELKEDLQVTSQMVMLG